MLQDQQGLFCRDASNQQPPVALNQFATNKDDLFGCLGLPKDNLRHALSQRPMVIDTRDAEINKWQMLQLMQGPLRANRAAFNILQ